MTVSKPVKRGLATLPTLPLNTRDSYLSERNGNRPWSPDNPYAIGKLAIERHLPGQMKKLPEDVAK
ncbi:MAG: hypothetical protein ABFD97_14850 [Syntrophobacter sp.]